MAIRYLSGINVDSNTLFVDDVNNRVGIGTGSPVSSLNINNGDAWINVTDTLRGLQFGYAGPSHGSYRAAVMGGAESYGGTDSGMLTFHTQNGYVVSAIPPERMRITSSGNVGIGITSASERLTVVSSGAGVSAARFTDANRADIVLSFPSNGVASIDSYQGASDGALAFRTAANERMRITSTGNVGIGTTSPQSKLQIGTTNFSIADRTSAVYGAAASETIFTVGISGVDYPQLLNFGVNQVGLYSTISARQFTVATENKLVLQPNGGNVGIGTTSPSYKLDVNGATQIQNELILSTNDAAFRLYRTTGINYFDWSSGQDLRFSTVTTIGGAGRSTAVTFLSDGNVGIGTTSPISKLTVLAASTGYSSDSQIKISDGSTSYYGGLSFDDSGATRLSIRNSYDGNGSVIGFGFGSSADKVQIIDGTGLIVNEGNVGIGTTAPQDKLTVKGATNYNLNLGLLGGYSGIYVYNDASSAYNHLRIDASPLLLNSYSGSNVAIAAGSAVTRLTIGAYSGARLPYINGTANTFDANGITVTSSNTANAAIGGGIDLTNNVHSVGSFSPLISFSALSQSGTYNNNYAAIYGILAGDSGDGNWNSGHLVFATALAYGASEKMRITNAGYVGIGTTSPANKLVAVADATFNNENSYAIAAASSTDVAYKTVVGYDYANDVGVISAVRTGIGWKNLSILPVGNTNLGVGTISPTERLHVSGNIRVTGAYYDSNNSAGSSGQVLSSTGSGTAWVNQGEATATSLYDLLPSARTTYAWSVQLTAGTWADIFSSNTVLSNGTWMVQVYVDDYAVGGQQYQETYSGVMSWGSANTTNQGGAEAISEVVLHRSGHAANAGNFYLRTVERVTSTLLLQGMSNQTYSAASTINFKFVKIF